MNCGRGSQCRQHFPAWDPGFAEREGLGCLPGFLALGDPESELLTPLHRHRPALQTRARWNRPARQRGRRTASLSSAGRGRTPNPRAREPGLAPAAQSSGKAAPHALPLASSAPPARQVNPPRAPIGQQAPTLEDWPGGAPPRPHWPQVPRPWPGTAARDWPARAPPAMFRAPPLGCSRRACARPFRVPLARPGRAVPRALGARR